MSSTTVLLGRNYPDPGAIASDAIADGRLGYAISNGGTDKPNEDAIVARDSDPCLLAVADGHWGHDASELAARRFAELTIDPADVTLNLKTAMQMLNDELTTAYEKQRELAVDPEGMLPPETTLLACVIPPGGGTMHWASFGDSYLFTRTAHGLLRLNESRRAWLGARIQGKVGQVLEIGTAKVAPGDSVLLATDGLLEPVIDGPLLPADQIGGILASELPTEGKARALTSAALALGGHDNVAVAIYNL